ncbi:MAG: pantetheine-phosphate adenylyltransferase [Planctomycetota bacterium]
MTTRTAHIACYSGSFDPPTLGHLDVIRRGRRIFDEIVVAIGQNPAKSTLFSADERQALMQTLVSEIEAEEPGEGLTRVERFDGLTVEFARAQGASVLLRGVRNLSDLTNELQMATTNERVGGMETVFVGAGGDFAYISSTLIRQITAMADDLAKLEALCPPLVIEALRAKKAANHELLRDLLDGASG